MLSLRLKLLIYFSIQDLFVLFLGKVFPMLRHSKFNELQDRENKLRILATHCQLISVTKLETIISYEINGVEFLFFLRLVGSDIMAFNQVIVNKEYSVLISCFRKCFKNDPLSIIDAGEHIGLTTMYFKALIPEARILALEPENENFERAKKSIETNSFLYVELLHSALWPSKRNLQVVSDFRDRMNWSFRVEENPNGEIISTTSDEVIDYFEGNVDLFKIDIEGGESRIFEEKNNMDWIRKVKMIAVEIHEELVNSNEIESLLKVNGFRIFKEGELTIGVNQLFEKTSI